MAFIVTTLLLSHVGGHMTYLFSTISLLFFDSFYLFINFVVYGYIFSNFFHSLLPFHLPTTINIYINFSLSSSFYFDYSYPHPLTIKLLISFTLYIFYHTKRLLLSLSLSLSLMFFFSFGSFFFKNIFCIFTLY